MLERQVATTHQPKRSLRPSKYFASMLCVVLRAPYPTAPDRIGHENVLQDEINWFDRFSWLLPILAIALLVASVVLSEPRRLGFRRLGIAIVAPTTISLLPYSWIRGHYVGGLPDDIHNPDAAAAFFDITTRFLPRDMRVLFAIGGVILFLVWLFGLGGAGGVPILGEIGRRAETISEDTSAQDTAMTEVDSATADSATAAAADDDDGAGTREVSAETGEGNVV